MKPGDLVELSAYARKLKHYYKDRHRDLAMVLGVYWGSFYNVRWISDGKRQSSIDRRDLRYVSKSK